MQVKWEVKWHKLIFPADNGVEHSQNIYNIIKSKYYDEGKILSNITGQDVVCKSNKIKDEIWRFHV